jgi:hypothetical protein
MLDADVAQKFTKGSDEVFRFCKGLRSAAMRTANSRINLKISFGSQDRGIARPLIGLAEENQLAKSQAC